MRHRLKNNSNFWLLWSAQVISGIGDMLYSAGIMVNVYLFTGSALQTAMIMVANTLPAFIISPFAGAIVDRYNRKNVLIVMDLIRFFLVFLLLFFVQEDSFQLPGLYLVVAALSTASAFYRPAKMAIIPSIVHTDNLGQANSLLIGTNQAIMAIGFGVGGLLTLWLGFEVFVYINATTFLLSAAISYFIKMPFAQAPDESAQASLLKSVAQGYHDLRRHKIAYPLVVMEIIEFFPHGIWTAAILLAFVEKELNGTADDWGFVTAAYFGGMLFGAIVATFAHHQINQRAGKIIVINAFITSVLTVAFGLSGSVFWAIIICVIFGFPNSIRDVAQDTLLQISVPQNLLGRVYAFRSMFTNIVFMIAGVFFAWLADFIDVRYIYCIGGFIYLLTAFYALSNKALRESKIDPSEVIA
ncbi:MAG: MFS transporter [Saprospiraceae bacterium]